MPDPLPQNRPPPPSEPVIPRPIEVLLHVAGDNRASEKTLRPLRNDVELLSHVWDGGPLAGSRRRWGRQLSAPLLEFFERDQHPAKVNVRHQASGIRHQASGARLAG